MTPFKCAEDVQREIEVYESLVKNLDKRIKIVKEKVVKEENLQHLLKFEQSRLSLDLEKLDEENGELQKEYDRVLKELLDKKRFLKRCKNLHEVNNIRIELKEQAMDKLQARLDSLDFKLEEKACDDNPDDNFFSQFGNI